MPANRKQLTELGLRDFKKEAPNWHGTPMVWELAMDRPVAKIGTRTLDRIPRGWVILALALASWAMAIAIGALANTFFNSILSAL